MKNDSKICSICQDDYVGFGNNAEPINNGRCCNDCNRIVVAARLMAMAKRLSRTKEKN